MINRIRKFLGLLGDDQSRINRNFENRLETLELEVQSLIGKSNCAKGIHNWYIAGSSQYLDDSVFSSRAYLRCRHCLKKQSDAIEPAKGGVAE